MATSLPNLEEAHRVHTDTTTYDIDAVRRDFPLLAQAGPDGRPLAYLDNAASAQKPRQVLDALQAFYTRDYANIHRGVHSLSQRATDAYDDARERVRAFLNAREAAECVFTRGSTEGVNLVASSYARPRLKPGANIVLTRMEHHANIVPWQLVMVGTGAELRVADVDSRGVLDVEGMIGLIDENTVIVSFVHVSNALGTINPAKQIIAAAH